MGGANVSISGAALRLTRLELLRDVLQIAATAFDDAGNSYAGIRYDVTHFTAADVVGPTMAITSTTSGVSSGSTTNDSSINLIHCK